MNALVLTETGLLYQELPAPVCGVDQVRIKLHAAALNHRDQYIREGKYSKIVLPAVLGSDGVGTVTEAPSHPELLGKRVVIDPSFAWGDDPRAQGPTYSILGMPTQGTFAEEVVVPAENVHRAPEHLTDEQAAALPLAGVTGYRALMVQGALQSGESVLVTGIGGGVASMIMMFALAAGAQVYVSSRSEEKIARAVEMGARPLDPPFGRTGSARGDGSAGPLDSARGDGSARPFGSAQGDGVDLVVDSIGGDTVNTLTNIVRPGGRLVFYGASRGAVPELNLHRIFWKQLQIIGSTMGTSQDFADMLRFVDEKKIVPVVDSTFALSDAEAAFNRLHAAGQFGKIVLRCN
ncbi:MAG: zinc-binding dehydrogenase [Ignavibacteria bacterium]|nr:zinc-binding dehydrogenase [Ignavibacteria bacterium]